MSKLLTPLRNARFSAKVGGGFVAMVLVAAAVGAVGTVAILGLRSQSDVSAKATASMANLQKVAQAQEAYLAGRSLELAETASVEIGQLEASLVSLDRSSGTHSGSEATAEAIALVGRLNEEFDSVVTAVENRQAQVDKLLRSAVGLETLAVQISDQMTKIQRDAGSAAKKASGTRNRADKVGRMLSEMEDMSAELGSLISKSGNGDDLSPQTATAVLEGAASLAKTAKKAAKLKVEGVDPAQMEELSGFAKALSEKLPKSDGEGASDAAISASLAAEVVSDLSRMHDQASSLRKVVYAATDGAKKIAGKAQSKLGIVDLVNVNVSKFLRASLEIRSATMEFFAGFESMGAEDVTTRVGILQNLANTLKADSAAFPEITDAVAAIEQEVSAYEAEFASMVAAKEVFVAKREALTTISADVRSVITGLTEAQSASASARADTALGLIAAALGAAVIVGGFLAFVLSLVITRPTRALTEAMGRLADGDTDVVIPSTGQRDEIGDMSRTVQVFQENARERVRLESEANVHQQEQYARQQEVELLIQDFREEIQSLLGALDETAADMTGTAKVLGGIAENSAEQAGDTARVSEDASMSVENVAGAAEELSASIAEIGDQVRRSSDIVTSATGAVHETNGKVQGLAEAASKIGEVVTLIQAIAEQTNLLALNATIEAARAGEAGKGFAVVAAEVKELANQTSKATEEISSQIQTIQTSTTDAVAAIGAISDTMEEVNGYTQGISSAVTQQGAATNEISGNVQRAAQSTMSVRSNMSRLAEAVGETRDASGNVLAASDDLSNRSEALKQGVETFLNRVASA
ncbi:MAG: HAMP domain-containing protein [Roseibium sp.]|uniref:methyl-accepting chemotaxis protein n=1 Tax=Roseibium sp. TaxID=1936156 RepID=UPI002606B44E|nr:methyl-accepting chemotaxis protein [Roseibium sp.]MCV0426847.1 HAMP domain-containing protein [Roseibium sp.]